MSVLGSAVVDDDHLGAKPDEAEPAGDGEAEEVLVHRGRDLEDPAERRDVAVGPYAGVGLAGDVEDDHRHADADEATGDGAGDAEDGQVVGRPHVHGAVGVDGAVDLSRRSGRDRRAERAAGHGATGRRAADRGRRAAQLAADARVGRVLAVVVEPLPGVGRGIGVGVVEQPLGGVGRGVDADMDDRVPGDVVVPAEADLVALRVGRAAHPGRRRRRRDRSLDLVGVAAEADLGALAVGRPRHPRRRRPGAGAHQDVLVAGRAVRVVVAGRGLVGAALG